MNKTVPYKIYLPTCRTTYGSRSLRHTETLSHKIPQNVSPQLRRVKERSSPLLIPHSGDIIVSYLPHQNGNTGAAWWHPHHQPQSPQILLLLLLTTVIRDSQEVNRRAKIRARSHFQRAKFMTCQQAPVMAIRMVRLIVHFTVPMGILKQSIPHLRREYLPVSGGGIFFFRTPPKRPRAGRGPLVIEGTWGERPMWASELFCFYLKRKKNDDFPSPDLKALMTSLIIRQDFFAAIDKRNVSQWNGNCICLYWLCSYYTGVIQGPPKRGKKGLKIFVVVVVALFSTCEMQVRNIWCISFSPRGGPWVASIFFLFFL